MTVDAIAAQLLGLEASALRKLDASTKAVIAASKTTPVLAAAAGNLTDSVSTTVIGFRDASRVAAAKQLAASTGLTIAPSGADDTERGAKAGAWYAKAWTKAMPTAYGGGGGTSGGGGSTESWEDAIELARADAAHALDIIAAFEVFDAWTNEQRRARESLPTHKWSVQWIALLDKSTCKVCKRLHLTYADANGNFVGGDPPAHGSCRCFLALKIVGTLADGEPITRGSAPRETRPMTYAINTHEPQPRAATDLMVRRDDALHVRAIRAESRECDFIASTETIDSYDEIVDQETWDLSLFETNPVILYNHDRGGLPIGQATRCEVVKGQLEVTIKFASAEANPEADRVWRLVQEKVLRAVSVGFRPGEGRYETRGKRDVYVLYKNVLREISVCPIGANPDCLAQMKAEALERAEPAMRARIRSANATRADRGLEPHADGSWSPRATTTTPERPAPSTPTNEIEGAKSAQEPAMDLKEATEKLEKTEKALVDAKASEKAATEKAAEADGRVKALETTVATLTSEHTKAADDRDAAIARAEKAEAEVIAHEVDALIGKKIAPTEKDDFIALRKSSPELFASMIAKRPDMNLTEPVIKADPAAPPALNGAPDAAASAAYWNKL